VTIEQGLVAELLADAGVSALVGTRVHPHVIPQDGELPAITYQRISSQREMQMDGPLSLIRVRMQVDCWSSSYSGAKSLADAVRSALNGVGIRSPKTLGSESVQLVFLESDNDLADFEGDKREYRVSQDWMIYHVED